MSEPQIAFTWDRVGLVIDGRTILREATLHIEQGTRWAIVGPTGAGKTSLIKVAHGLQAPSSGRVQRGACIERDSFVFQQPVFLRNSVLANVSLPLRLAGIPRRGREALAREALAQVGLEGRELDPAHRLSGGQQQKLALARALICKPQLLWLDEPTASLDSASTRAIEATLKAQREGLTLALVTHDLRQARRLCSHLAVVIEGTVQASGPMQEVYAQQANAEVQRFLSGGWDD